MPILENGILSDRPIQRQGVCIGLTNILHCTSEEEVMTCVNSIVSIVTKALCDPVLKVRQAAVKSFEHMHSSICSKALDNILPTLLEQLVSFVINLNCGFKKS